MSKRTRDEAELGDGPSQTVHRQPQQKLTAAIIDDGLSADQSSLVHSSTTTEDSTIALSSSSSASAATALKARRRCPYLDTINRQYLDFDNEKVCSVTLSNINVYACLVCGKFFQGRNQTSVAYTHSVQMSHFVFMNLHDGRAYCLPDNYEIIDSSLQDVQKCLFPKYTAEKTKQLDRNILRASDCYGVTYLPGFIGLNNLKATDYINAVLHAISHLPLVRNFFLLNNYSGSVIDECKSKLVKNFATVVAKIWSDDNFKSVVSPQEFVQEVTNASRKRFNIATRSECMEFMTWLLQEMHRELFGKRKKKGLSFLDHMQGEIEVTTYSKRRADADSSAADPTAPTQGDEEIHGWTAGSITRTPFLYLNVDIPPCPLFRDSQGGLVIPQIPIFEVLKKYEHGTITDVQTANSGHVKKKYNIVKLPRYLILQINRFTKNNFSLEKNPTIVTFPVKNFEMRDYCEPPSGAAAAIAASDLPSNEEIDGMDEIQLRTLLAQLPVGATSGEVSTVDHLRAAMKTNVSMTRELLCTKYDLVANICHDSLPATQNVAIGSMTGSAKKIEKASTGAASGGAVTSSLPSASGGNGDPLTNGCYRVHVQNRATMQWYEIQDLHVAETIPQLVGLSESCVLIYEKKYIHQ